MEVRGGALLEGLEEVDGSAVFEEAIADPEFG